MIPFVVRRIAEDPWWGYRIVGPLVMGGIPHEMWPLKADEERNDVVLITLV